MNYQEYFRLSKELQVLVKNIPLNWGDIQNNSTDQKIKMFNCQTLDALEEEIKKLNDEEKNYFRRRWFLWQCSKVDEYLFYKEENVEKNPDPKSQSWDIKFNNKIIFDVKGTVVPKSLRKTFDINKEEELIDFYYKNQSKGVRYNTQNRLFIVHHSFKKSERSIYLRCYWKLKIQAYRDFNNLISYSKLNFIKYNEVLAKCIFIMEDPFNNFYYKIV